jgi:hypothetical protein
MPKYLVVINFWGGLPSCLTDLVLNSEFVNEMGLGGVSRPRAYVTNTDPNEAFRHVVYANIDGSETETIFHKLQKAGYKTVMFGAFGLDPTLNPNPPRRNYNLNAERSLCKFGIEHFSHSDGAYHTGSAIDHDKKVLQEASFYVMDDDSVNSTPTLLWINLLGCSDALRRRTNTMNSSEVKQGIDLQNWSQQINTVFASNTIPKNISAEYQKNDICHEISNDVNKAFGEHVNDKIDVKKHQLWFHLLQMSARNDLRTLEHSLLKFIKIVKSRSNNITSAVLSTHVFALEEHNVRQHAPVESCCQSFWYYNNGRSNDVDDAPVGMLSFCDCIIKDICAQTIRRPSMCLTMKNCLLKTCFENITETAILNELYWVRMIVNANGKYFSVTFATRLRDVVSGNKMNPPSDTELYKQCKRQQQWKITDSVYCHSIFDLTLDRYETINLKSVIENTSLSEYIINTVKQQIKSLPKWTVELNSVNIVEPSETTTPPPPPPPIKKILKFDPTPPAVSIVPRKDDAPPSPRPQIAPRPIPQGMSAAAKINLRRRESMLNAQHR